MLIASVPYLDVKKEELRAGVLHNIMLFLY